MSLMHEFNQHTKIDQNIRFGKPTVKKLLIATFHVLGNFSKGVSWEIMVLYFPEITKDYLQDCVKFSSEKKHKIRMM